MFINLLKIKNFRNIAKLTISFNSHINYFYSPNGTGKTNLLEAIQCISVGKSLRVKSENELIPFNNEKQDPTIIHASCKECDLDFTQSYTLETEPKRKKILYRNKNKTKLPDYVGKIPSIWFSPESIKIINSSPKNKRKYFDDILIQLYPDYLHNLRYYNRALQSRNKLLQDNNIKPNQIRIWTEQLILYGSKLLVARHKFYNLLNTHFEQLDSIHRYQFKVDFSPNIKMDSFFDEDPIYRFREELRSSYKKDISRRTTSVGPHKDDWHILICIISEKNKQGNQSFIRCDKYASRGQQRMSLILLQMVLIDIFQTNTGKKPILLLDDIFSELDEKNERLLLDYIHEQKIQTFITGVASKRFHSIDEFNISALL